MIRNQTNALSKLNSKLLRALVFERPLGSEIRFSECGQQCEYVCDHINSDGVCGQHHKACLTVSNVRKCHLHLPTGKTMVFCDVLGLIR